MIYKSIINLFNKNESNKNYIYFNALEKSNLPNHDVQQNHYDIIIQIRKDTQDLTNYFKKAKVGTYNYGAKKRL